MMMGSTEIYEGGPDLHWRERRREGGHVLIDVAGELDVVPEVERFKTFMEERYVDDGVNHITVGLKEVRFINLEGVGVLLGLRKESLDRGKQFDVEYPRSQVLEKLRVTGVLELLETD
jgi:anti-anti-sigma factor